MYEDKNAQPAEHAKRQRQEAANLFPEASQITAPFEPANYVQERVQAQLRFVLTFGDWGLPLDDSTCFAVACRRVAKSGLEAKQKRAYLSLCVPGRAVVDSTLTFRRSTSRKVSPVSASRCSSLSVQSQEVQAQGSVPFSSRHRRRSWASWMRVRSKYSSQ